MDRIDIDACIRLARQQRNDELGRLFRLAWQGATQQLARLAGKARATPALDGRLMSQA